MLPTFVLVSRMQFAQRYRDNTTSFSGVSSSRIEGMVGGALVRNSTFRVGLGVGGTRLNFYEGPILVSEFENCVERRKIGVESSQTCVRDGSTCLSVVMVLENKRV